MAVAFLVTRFSPEWQEDTVAGEYTQTPYDGDSHTDVAEVVVGASQKVPGSQLFWCESLSDFVLHDTLYAFLAKIKDVTEGKVSLVERFWMRSPEFHDLFFHRTIVLLDNSWNDRQSLVMIFQRSLKMQVMIKVKLTVTS